MGLHTFSDTTRKAIKKTAKRVRTEEKNNTSNI